MKVLLKEGRAEFKAWCNNDELFNRFLDMRRRLPSPESDMEYWRLPRNGKTPDDLRNYLDNYKSETQKEKEKALAGKSEKNMRVIFDDDNWRVTQILTYAGARELGDGTVWCMTGRYPGHENQGYHWFANYMAGSGGTHYRGFFLFERKHHSSGKCTSSGQKDPSGHNWDWKYMVCPLWSDPRNRADIYQQNDGTLRRIPDCYVSIKGLPVVGDNSTSQANNDNLSMQDGVVSRLKFYRSSNILDGVVELKDRALLRCNTGGYNTLNATDVKKIGKLALAGTEFMDYELKVCDEIGEAAFKACVNAKQIFLGNITNIPSQAFAFCGDFKLKLSTPAETDIEIADDAFENSVVTILLERPSEKVIEFVLAHKNIELENTATGEVIGGLE